MSAEDGVRIVKEGWLWKRGESNISSYILNVHVSCICILFLIQEVILEHMVNN